MTHVQSTIPMNTLSIVRVVSTTVDDTYEHIEHFSIVRVVSTHSVVSVPIIATTVHDT